MSTSLVVVFLDIDGVLNSERSAIEHEGHPEKFGSYHMEALNRLVELSGAVVVVSSTWRWGRSAARLQCILDEQGFKGKVLDRTGHFQVRNEDGAHVWAKRGEEIQEWLTDRAASNPDEKLDFVILDDDRDMLHLMDHLVWTGAENGGPQPGLLLEHVEPAMALLKDIH